MPGMNALHQPISRLNIKGAGFAHAHPAHMRPGCLERGRNSRPHPVAGLEAPHELLAHEIATREAFSSEERAAVSPSSARPDAQGGESARLDQSGITNA